MRGLATLIEFNNEIFRWIFSTGRLSPSYDWFHCVINIPDDTQHMKDFSDVNSEPLLIMGPDISSKSYGSATLAGKDETSGRINPALEPDDDMDPEEVAKLIKLQKNAGLVECYRRIGANMQQSTV